MDTKVPQAFNGVGKLLWLQKSHNPSVPQRYVTMDTNRHTDVTLGTNWYTTCGKGHLFSYLNNLLVYGVLQKCYHEIHVFFKKKNACKSANFDHELDNNERCLTIIYYTLSLNVHAKSFNYEKKFLF